MIASGRAAAKPVTARDTQPRCGGGSLKTLLWFPTGVTILLVLYQSPVISVGNRL
jgi:hypothetical protein